MWNSQKSILLTTNYIKIIFKNNYASEVTFKIDKPFKLHKLKDSPSTTVKLNKNDALEYYKQMLTIRRIENASDALYKAKVIRGFCHLYSGQEAICVGMKAAMRPHDDIITAYRAHGWCYVMGISALGVLSELTGRHSGCARGKGGSMHMYAPHFYGGNGIVGAQVPLGAGIALASQYKGTDGICIAAYGDGAANQGQIFEVYNMCKLWNIPVIFLCENNTYAMGTSSKRGAASPNYYTRGDYIPGIWADGMDILAMREVTKYCIKYCSSGKGPLVLEAYTYRYAGHSMSDPGTSYRTRKEIQAVRSNSDPITTFRAKIIKELVKPEELKKIDAEVKKYVDAATKQCQTDKEVGLDELQADVYAGAYTLPIRNVTPFKPLAHKRIGKAVNLK